MSVTTTEPIIAGVLGDWLLEVAPYTDGTEPTAWTLVRGITELTPPQTEKNLEDDGEYDGTFWGSQIATGISWTAEGTMKVPRASLPADPGQAILKAASREIAEDGLVHVRFRKRNAVPATGDEGIADVSYVEAGGPKTDLTTAELTLTGRGKLVAFAAADSAALWEAAKTYQAGEMAVLSTGESLRAQNGGLSGVDEPDAPLAIGGIVVDGTVSWERTA
ncbi:phage tail tube protein [Citricoccus sp.]|uniref:phage tail tube protein n=1 Tax=Citricoccus sp. TaxID=1978372 RepID=UPI0028BE7A6D|nr:hypothetical protein [Citricoccus sp.]